MDRACQQRSRSKTAHHLGILDIIYFIKFNNLFRQTTRQTIQLLINVTMRRVRATTVAVEKQKVLHILSVCVCVCVRILAYFLRRGL